MAHYPVRQIMKTVQFLGESKVTVREVPRPDAEEGTVILRVAASGLCGSELHAFSRPRADRDESYNSGHEVAGVIEEAPQGSPYQVGMRVGARVVQGCGDCHWCNQGYETACGNKRFFSGNGHSEYFRLGVNGIQPVPDGVDWPTAVILTGDGLGVPVRAARRLGDTSGKKVLVLGLGPVGLSSVLVQSSRGAEVMGADLFDYRASYAQSLGAARTVNVTSQDLKQEVLDWTDGFGPEIVILAVGRADAFRQAIDLVARQGTVYQVGEFEEATINPSAAFIRKEISVTGSWYYASEDWADMLAMHESGAPLGKLVSHVYPLEQAQEAYDTFASGNSAKVVLTYGD